MQTLFSYIIQKRFSNANEDVATEALAYILSRSKSAQTGFMKMIRGLVPEMPQLAFYTQYAHEQIRPDMVGRDDDNPRVFIENKFWAGLTENQPIAYLKYLAQAQETCALLMIVPDAREQSVWRELCRRLETDKLSYVKIAPPAGLSEACKTEIGPFLALTSWRKVLAALEVEMSDDPDAKNDLNQLRSLCESADNQAFLPLSASALTNQETPSFLLQLMSLVQALKEASISQQILTTKGLQPQSSWERMGQYAKFVDTENLGIWFGVHFQLWLEFGDTPLWVVFTSSETFGRAKEIRHFLESWASKSGIFSCFRNDNLNIALQIKPNEELNYVIKDILLQLKQIQTELQRNLGVSKR